MDHQLLYLLYLEIFLLLTGFEGYNITTTVQVNTCPAPPPCSCDQDNILCDGRNLSRIPIFNKHHVKYHWQLNLSNNNITEIPSDAFENLHIYSLLMWNTGLTSLGEDAFAGSENTLISMSLINNNLSELPTAIGKLRNITTLRINNNPIIKFTESVFINISSTLNFLDMGFKAMTSWPTSIRHLKSLFALNVYDIPMPDLPTDAFSGLEQCLTLLNFQSTMLEVVPLSINRLRALQGITLTDNSRLTSSGFSKDVFANMPNFTDITIINSSIPTMPNFSKVVNLHSMLIQNCGVEEWDDSALANTATLSYLAFNYTRFRTFPKIISRLTHLQVLSMSYGQFQELPSGAFAKLQNLTRLELISTPISNISYDAFDENPNLQTIRLEATALTEIPKAIEKVPSLRYLEMWNDPLNCSCATMGWLKHWKHFSSIVPSGKCENINGTDLATYITTCVPKCPNA